MTLWGAASGRVIGRPITTNPPGSGGAQSISFSPDSKRIAVPGAPGTVGIWDVATGRRVGEPLAIGSADVEAAIFAEGGRTLIASDDSGSVSMVDVRTGRRDPPAALGRRRACRLRWTSARTDGCWPSASFDGSVFVWDAKTGAPYGSPLTADTSPVNDVAFSPDGRTLVSSHLRSAVVWNVNGEQVIGRAARRPDRSDHRRGLQPRRQAARRGAVRRRHDRVRRGDAATGSSDRRRFGRHRGRVPARWEAHRRRNDRRRRCGSSIRRAGRPSARRSTSGSAAVWQVAFSPDGRLLAVAVDPNGVDGFNSQQRQGEVQLWDVDSRHRVGRAIKPGARIGAVRRLQSRTARCSRPAATAGGSTSGTWPPRPTTASR